MGDEEGQLGEPGEAFEGVRRVEGDEFEGVRRMEGEALAGVRRVEGEAFASAFEAIRRTGEDGGECWSARDLAKMLAYSHYRQCVRAIARAEVACRRNGYAVEDHFRYVREAVVMPSGVRRELRTVLLSRYGCELLLQHADLPGPAPL